MEFLLKRGMLGIQQFDLLVKGPESFEKRYSKFVGKTSKDRLVIPSGDYWELCSLYNRPYRTFPPKRFKRAYQTVMNPGGDSSWEFPRDFQWQAVIPKEIYKKELRNFVQELTEDYQDLTLDYYFGLYKKHEIVFNSLRRAAINLTKYEEFMADGNEGASKAVLRSFAPAKSHQGVFYASRVEYDRFSSITGRLTIKNGPGILHLRKDYRQVLTSKWGKDGGVYYVDFRSLEPRILLALKNNQFKAPQDLYMNVAQEMGLGENVDRNIIKTVIISMIYGAGDEELIKKLHNKIDYPEQFVESIKEHFGVEDLRLRLKEEYEANKGKFIYNYYKRPIFAEAVAPYVLVNYLIQSTAVDVALTGFSNILERLEKSKGFELIRPLYVLHDALILDVHNTMAHLLPKIAKAGSLGIPGFEGTRFWLEVERLS